MIEQTLMTHHSQKTISFSLLDRHARNNLQTRRKCPLVTYYKKTASQFHFSRRELDLYDSKTSFIRIWNFGSTRNRWRTVNRSLNRSHLKTDWRLRRVALCGLFFFCAMPILQPRSHGPFSWCCHKLRLRFQGSARGHHGNLRVRDSLIKAPQ